MKKFFLYAVLSLAACLLAACSQSGDTKALASNNATITIHSQDVALNQASATAPAFSILSFSADVAGNAAADVEWSVSPTDVRFEQDSSTHNTIKIFTQSANVGTVTLTARSGNADTSVSFDVEEAQVTRRLVFLSEPSIMLFGDNISRKLEARLLDENNEPVDVAITFTSSNPSALSVSATSASEATVTSNGMVDSAVITARYGNLEASTVVLYTELGDTSRFVASDAIISAAGDTVTLERTAATEALVAGDIVVSDSAYGLADKVVFVDNSGDNLVLTLKHVQPYVAFKQISTDIQLPIADISARLTGSGQGVLSTHSPNGELMNQTLIESSSCTDADGNATSELLLEGSDITLETRVTSDFHYEAGFLSTKVFRLVLHSETDLIVTSGKLTFKDAQGERINCSIDLGSEEVEVTQICPWGLGITYEASIVLAAEGTQEGGDLVVDNVLTATFKQASDIGVEYTAENGWNSISDAEILETTFLPIAEDANAVTNQFDVSKTFETTIAASSNHTFFVNICKGQVSCCYYYYHGCYYRQCKVVYRHVAEFAFAELESKVTLTANNEFTDQSVDDYGYPIDGGCYTLSWNIDFNTNGNLHPSIVERTTHDAQSFNHFTHWILCIWDLFEFPEDAGYNQTQSYSGSIEKECTDSVIDY